MDAYRLLTERLVESGQSFFVDLICQPSDSQMQALMEGSGHPDSEMRQINSSAGLAVNFWRAYELFHPGCSVEFEWQKQRPLRYGRPANIDVVVSDDDTVTFIESKFLEPYYSGNETPNDSYLQVSRYSKNTKDSPQSWIALFSKAKEFKFYNVTQLCRHLLSICKDMWKNPRFYEKKTIKLCSVTWDMPDGFTDIFVDDVIAEFDSRRRIIREEADKCESLLNDFISEHLDFQNLGFEAIKYNDIIGQLENSPYYLKIKEQYYL